jgi:Domain of unknown function (DUF4382)
MAINTKKISLYVFAGIAAAVILIAAVYTSGIRLPSNAGSQNPITLGTLTVSIKDAPVQLSTLEVTIDSIEVQSENNGWTKLPFIEGTQTVHFDLLALQDISKDLSTTQLRTGDYSKIRLHVKDATATFADGKTAVLKVPFDKIDIIVKFEIKEGATTKVLIDMTADSVAISNSNNLKPVLKATVTPPAPVSTPTESPSISAPTASPTETSEPTPTENPTPTPMPTPTSMT